MKYILNAAHFCTYSVALNLDVEMVTTFVYFSLMIIMLHLIS